MGQISMFWDSGRFEFLDCLIFMSTEPLTIAGRGPGARGLPTQRPSINRQSVKLCEKVNLQ